MLPAVGVEIRVPRRAWPGAARQCGEAREGPGRVLEREAERELLDAVEVEPVVQHAGGLQLAEIAHHGLEHGHREEGAVDGFLRAAVAVFVVAVEGVDRRDFEQQLGHAFLARAHRDAAQLRRLHGQRRERVALAHRLVAALTVRHDERGRGALLSRERDTHAAGLAGAVVDPGQDAAGVGE